MTTLFCIRPATRNIGNDLIYKATCDLIHSVFGADAAIVSIPALQGAQYGGLTAAQVYDINRFADGVIVGGGNLFENGQLTIDRQALAALRVPMLLIGISHGRIYDDQGRLVERTDSMAPDSILQLVRQSAVVLVRDRGTKHILEALGAERVELGGCPSMFLPAPAAEPAEKRRVLISVRHPARMSVPPELQWRAASDLRALIEALRKLHGEHVHLVCHDYKDIEFAHGFPDTPFLYFDDANLYIEALRSARLNVTYRLHAFLPCLTFGTPSIHLSYDERGSEMVATAGMGDWDVDLIHETDVVATVMRRAGEIERYHALRAAAQAAIRAMRATSEAGIRRFAAEVAASRSKGPR